jgi:hypothetical protein
MRCFDRFSGRALIPVTKRFALANRGEVGRRDLAGTPVSDFWNSGVTVVMVWVKTWSFAPRGRIKLGDGDNQWKATALVR